MFVDSKVTIATKEKEYKRQNAEMEKAAKAAFENDITLLAFAKQHVIIVADR
ncbi:hypothetical protein CSC12_5043 [Klebsiella michiganensis]|nr:hypothetical protein CSC12_5043 [Klebsiella michiganensis]GKQ19751.1 hypothetical protein NUBL21980_29680 [Klebsiella michiganensis]